MIQRKSRGISGIVGVIILILVGIGAILIWDHLWSEAQGTQSILDDFLVFISQLIAWQITIGTIEIPVLGIVIVITLAGVLFRRGGR